MWKFFPTLLGSPVYIPANGYYAWRAVLMATPYVIRFLWVAHGTWGLTLYNLTSVCIYSQSTASLFSEHFLYSHDLNLRFWGDIVRRN